MNTITEYSTSDNAAVLLPGYKHTKVGVIPDGWITAKLRHKSELISKGTTPTTLGKAFVDRGISFVKIEAITEDGRIDHSKLAFIDPQTHELLKRSRLRTNDILFSIAGALGRTAIVGDEIIPANTNQALALIRLGAKSGVNHTYLLYFLRSEGIRRHVEGINVQAAQANLSLENIRDFEIKLPPLPEQQAIAAVLSDVDGLIEALEKLITKKQHIKQGAMQQLLTGKKRLPGFTGDWEVKKLEEIFSISAGGDLIKGSFSSTEDSAYCYPIYSNSLTNKGLYGFSKLYRYDENCITVTARGTIGVANARDHKFDAIGRVLILKPTCDLSCLFVSEYLNNRVNFSIESTGVPQLTAPQISKYEISLPRPDEQTAIAAVLSDIDAEIAALERRREKTRAIKQGMMQALLTGRVRLVNREANA
jgi:type I restriction enzyme S subunit